MEERSGFSIIRAVERYGSAELQHMLGVGETPPSSLGQLDPPKK